MHPLYMLGARSVVQLLNCFSSKHGVPSMHSVSSIQGVSSMHQSA